MPPSSALALARLTYGVHGDVDDDRSRTDPVSLHQPHPSGRRDQDVRATNLLARTHVGAGDETRDERRIRCGIKKRMR